MVTSAKICKQFLAAAMALSLLLTTAVPQPAASAPLAEPAGAAPAAQVSSGNPDEAVPMPAAPDLDLPLPNIIVNTASITNNDPVEDGKCDLYEAMQAVYQANYGMSPTYHECTAKVDAKNIIGFSVNLLGTLIVVPPDLDLPMVWGDTVIVGPIGFAGTSGKDTHIFRMAGNASLLLLAVTIKNTHTGGCGPAVLDQNRASVTIVASFLVGNDADYDGGAVCSNGDVSLIGTSFINNKTNSAPGRGGAVYVDGYGSFKSEASTFTANKANSGGAIYVAKSGGSSSVSDSIFTGNIVTGDSNNLGGGAIFNYGGTLEVQRTAFNANIGLQGQGGAIVNNINATAAITNTLFDGNLVGDVGSNMDGGAMKNMGILRLSKSTFVSNLAQGGSGGAIAFGSNSVSTIANTTFSANSASENGGALFVNNTSTVAIRNSTLNNNSAGTAANSIFTINTTNVQIGNTILNQAVSLVSGCDKSGISSLGHNLDRDGSCVSSPTDIIGADPQLGGLSFNGGGLPVLTTHMPAYTSPVVDAGDTLICADLSVNNEDEIGTKRPKDANNTGTVLCDIGAVEVPPKAPKFDAMPLPPGPLVFGSIQVNTSNNASLTIKNPGTFKLTLSDPVLGDTVHFGVNTTFPVVIDPGSQYDISLACTPDAVAPFVSTFKISTSDADKLDVTYMLECAGASAPKPVFTSSPALPAPIEFGPVTVGGSLSKNFVIANTGKADLTINSVTYTGSSVINPNLPAAPFTLAAGTSQPYSPSCTPTDAGLFTGQLTLATNDPEQPEVTFNVNCTGFVPAPELLENTENLKNPLLPSDFVTQSGIAFSQDGQYAYAVGDKYLSNPAMGQIVILKRGVWTNTKTQNMLMSATVSLNALTSPTAIAVSPDDQFVLATGIFYDALVIYQRDSGTGNLTLLGVLQNNINGVLGMDNPSDLAFSPDGRYVYVTGNASNSIAVFKQDDNLPSKFGYVGKITTTSDNTNHPLSQPQGIAVSPDGKSVYVTNYTTTPDTNGYLAVYSRNIISGALNPIQVRWQNDTQDNCLGCFPMVGLLGAYDVTVSPDSANVYVTGNKNNSLITFIRDQTTGEVHLPYAFITGVFGFTGLTGATGVTVSPKGDHVYVVSSFDHTLWDFYRDIHTHLIFPVKAYTRDSVSGQPALGMAQQVAVSNDGELVLATAQSDKAVVLFQKAFPVPTLYSLSPASAMEGSGDLTLAVHGTGFVQGSQIEFDGTVLNTTYVNEYELDGTVPAARLASASTPLVKVRNPAPGGGISTNSKSFWVTVPAVKATTMTIPIPSIDYVTPGGVKAGDASFTLDIYGANYTRDSKVFVNNVEMTLSVRTGTHLALTVDASQVAQAGTLAIKVNNGQNADSNLVGLVVAPPGLNPPPTIFSLSPDFSLSPGSNTTAFKITITGLNFVEGAVAYWNGSERPTEFVDSTHLKVTITGSDQLFPPTQNSITVQNPLPGGGLSNILSFTVYQLYRVFLPLLSNK